MHSWKWYRQYLEEYPNKDINSYEKILNNNVMIFSEMINAIKDTAKTGTMNEKWLMSCNSNYEKIWKFVDLCEGYIALHQQIKKSSESVLKLRKQRSEKNMFLAIVYTLPEYFTIITDDMRNGGKQYKINDLFELYSLENEITVCENQRRINVMKKPRLVAEKNAANSDPTSPHYKDSTYINQRDKAIKEIEEQIAENRNHFSQLTKQLKALKAKLDL